MSSKINAKVLIEAGFECLYGNDGCMLKRMKVRDMPYANEHMVDDQTILPSHEAVTKVRPDWTVELSIPSAGYREEPVPVDSPEGYGLLRDAGVVIPE